MHRFFVITTLVFFLALIATAVCLMLDAPAFVLYGYFIILATSCVLAVAIVFLDR